MSGQNYPGNWDEIREQVRDKHLDRCVNCHRPMSSLEIHHIVPINHGGVIASRTSFHSVRTVIKPRMVRR